MTCPQSADPAQPDNPQPKPQSRRRAASSATPATQAAPSAPSPDPDTCSDADLLAMVCTGGWPGLTACIPSWSRGLAGLTSLTEAQAMAQLGIRRRGARRLLLAFALHRRLLAAAVPDWPFCRSPEEIAVIMRPLVAIDHERLWCLPLDPRCRLIGAPIEVARGDVDGTDASARAVCRTALRAGAVSMIIVHNHPSGDVAASAADAAVTRRLATAARTVDVPLQDHIICTSDGRWTSLRRERPDLFV